MKQKTILCILFLSLFLFGCEQTCKDIKEPVCFNSDFFSVEELNIMCSDIEKDMKAMLPSMDFDCYLKITRDTFCVHVCKYEG